MKTRNKRILAGLLPFVWAFLLLYLGGFEFERGFVLAYWFFFASVLAGLGASFPFNKEF